MTMPSFNFRRRLGCTARLLWVLTLALGACHEDPDVLRGDAAPIPERDAAGPSGDAAVRDAGAAADAETGARSDGSAEAGSPHDASAMDARTDASPGPDAGPVADASTGMDASTAPDADASPPAEAAVPPSDAQAQDAGLDGASTPPDARVVLPSIYDDDTKWLCRPGLPNNPCDQKLEVTELWPDGGVSLTELPKTPADVGVDCLYLYPTVDPGLFTEPRNLDFPQIDRTSVTDVFFAQAVPFRGTCALYAPLYRQMSLNSFEEEATREKGLQIAYKDLEAAFDYYLSHAAPGRPIVLLSHSQGSYTMARLIQRRFENQPELLARLVVAVLAGPMGAGFVVPQGGVVGGTFKQVPLCTAAGQNGCVLTYNSFAASAPPNDQYGKFAAGVPAGFNAGCTSPPAGSNGSAQRLSGALFFQFTGGLTGLLGPQFDYSPARVRTRYARLPDFYTARCADSETGITYLRITAEPLPGDVRKDPVPYNNVTLTDRSLGLHGLDYTFVAGELLQAVQTKISAHPK